MKRNIQIQFSKSIHDPTIATDVLVNGLAKLEANLMRANLWAQIPSWPAHRAPALRIRFA